MADLIPPLDIKEFNKQINDIDDTLIKKEKINKYITEIAVEHDYSKFSSIDDLINYIRIDTYHMIIEIYNIKSLNNLIVIINKGYRKIIILSFLLLFFILLYMIFY